MAQYPYNAALARQDGTKEGYREFPVMFYGWQTEERNQFQTLYTSDFQPLTASAVSGGSASFTEDRPRTVGNKYQSVIDLSNLNRPFAKFSRNVLRVTAAGAGSGVSYDFEITFDEGTTATAVNKLGLVMKVSTTMNVSIILEDASTNTATYTFNSVGTSYDLYTIDLASPTSTSGTPDLTTAKITITGSAAGTIDIYTISSANNIQGFVGAKISTKYHCNNETTLEFIRDMAETLCGNYVTKDEVTSASVELTLTTSSYSLAQEGMVFGENLNTSAVDLPVYLNAPEGGRTQSVITAGAITLPTNLDYALLDIEIDGHPIAVISNLGSAEPGVATYNATTGALTFNTLWNGKIPTVMYIESKTGVANYQYRSLETGFVGNLFFTDVAATRRTWQFYCASPISMTPTKEDANTSYETMMKCYPVQIGKYFTFGRRSEI